ncbi:MAG TPA: hypothetical protein VNV14_07565 [Opitutaceae bacterium]|jgi:hypothetical protein|nr:hypothetical protein [Opitutaceae bacterium]
MKLRLLIAALTVLVFAAGFGASVWTQHHCPLLAPPVNLLGEVRDRNVDVRLPLNDASTIAQINAEIERIKPDIDAFRQKLDAINHDLHQKIDALLTPAQHEKFEKMHKHYLERQAERAKSSLPIVESLPSGGSVLKLPVFAEPIEGMTPAIVVPLTLDHLTTELQLDDRQKAAVRQLLLERREKFLALIDSTPPPSIGLSRLAPIINKLAAPDNK